MIVVIYIAGLVCFSALAFIGVNGILRGEPPHVAYMRLIPGLEGLVRRAMLKHIANMEAEAAGNQVLADQFKERGKSDGRSP